MRKPVLSPKTIQYINLFAGFILLGIAIIEIVEESGEAGLELEHGLVIFASGHILKCLLEMYESSHKLIEINKRA